MKKMYKVKEGQTLRLLAAELSTTEYALIAENDLRKELYAGQVLRLPGPRDVYTVQAGDTKRLLCGSEENYKSVNGTSIFYIGMRVRL